MRDRGFSMQVYFTDERTIVDSITGEVFDLEEFKQIIKELTDEAKVLGNPYIYLTELDRLLRNKGINLYIYSQDIHLPIQ